MRVHAVKRDPTRGSEGAERVFAVAQLDEALANADHVACILPDEASTRGLFDRRALSRMKPSAYLYNLGRGSAIEESALLEALTTGRIAGAFLDVTELEPLPKDSPLWTAPNLVLTPHASAIYLEYLDLYFEELAHTLARLAQMATL
jgi:phosphoglycerate dehydrogenase-like enzyme